MLNCIHTTIIHCKLICVTIWHKLPRAFRKHNAIAVHLHTFRHKSCRHKKTYLYLILLPRLSAWRRRQHAMITMVTTRMTRPTRSGSAADTRSLDSGHESVVGPGMTTCVVLVLVSTRSKCSEWRSRQCKVNPHRPVYTSDFYKKLCVYRLFPPGKSNS